MSEYEKGKWVRPDAKLGSPKTRHLIKFQGGGVPSCYAGQEARSVWRGWNAETPRSIEWLYVYAEEVPGVPQVPVEWSHDAGELGTWRMNERGVLADEDGMLLSLKSEHDYIREALDALTRERAANAYLPPPVDTADDLAPDPGPSVPLDLWVYDREPTAEDMPVIAVWCSGSAGRHWGVPSLGWVGLRCWTPLPEAKP